MVTYSMTGDDAVKVPVHHRLRISAHCSGDGKYEHLCAASKNVYEDAYSGFFPPRFLVKYLCMLEPALAEPNRPKKLLPIFHGQLYIEY
jgi:hypothetical protein